MFTRNSLIALLMAVGLASTAWAQQAGGNGGQNPPQPPPPAPTVTAPAPSVAPPVPPMPNVTWGMGDDEGEAWQGPNPTADPYASGAPKTPTAKQAAGYPGDDDGGAPPEEEELTPQNPVKKAYEDGKIIVLVGSERHFGYRIGDVTPVTIMVLVDDKVQINFDMLQRGILGSDGSDFELVEPVSAQIVAKKEGKTLYRFQLKVRSFVPKKGIAFTAEFMYAVEMNPDGKTPNWKQVVTPDFVITTSNTADSGSDLLEGDLSEGRGHISWFTYPLLVLGLTGVLLWPALIFWRWYRRVRPPRVIPDNELAWATFDKVLKDGKASGFTTRHYKQLAFALRRYLGVQPATTAEAVARLKDHPDLAAIESALQKCDRVLYSKQPLEDSEHAELVAELNRIVPRP